MKTIVEKNGWKFIFDKNKTSKYYENYSDLCQCESCKNFYSNVKYISQDVRRFIEQFGIDIAKPIEQESIIADKKNKIVENTVYYAVIGEIIKSTVSDIQLGKVLCESSQKNYLQIQIFLSLTLFFR